MRRLATRTIAMVNSYSIMNRVNGKDGGEDGVAAESDIHYNTWGEKSMEATSLSQCVFEPLEAKSNLAGAFHPLGNSCDDCFARRKRGKYAGASQGESCGRKSKSG